MEREKERERAREMEREGGNAMAALPAAILYFKGTPHALSTSERRGNNLKVSRTVT